MRSVYNSIILIRRGGKMLYYIIPEYKDGLGSCCRVGDQSGEVLHQYALQAVLRRLLSERGMDLKSLRKQCAKEIVQRNLIPLYMGCDEVLMPLKVRDPRVKRDGGYGYINVMAMKKLEAARIILKDETAIDYLESRRSVARRLRLSQRLQQHMSGRTMGIAGGEMALTAMNTATREDVAIVALELARLRKEIMELFKKKDV